MKTKFDFFAPRPDHSSENKQAPCKVLKSTDIEHILSHPKPGSLVILDIDDTVGRVSQTIGLDAWFRFRIEQYASEGHQPSQALTKAIEIYNMAQLASKQMVAVDRSKNIAALVLELKNKGIKVIGLTARNHHLTQKTLSLLDSLGVSFSDDVLNNGSLELNSKPVEVMNGVIFANGNHKGLCLELAIEQGQFSTDFHAYTSVSFVDDSEKNCHAVAESLTKLKIADCSVWHYHYAETHLAFEESDKERSAIQEAHLLEFNTLLTDEEADQVLSNRKFT